jgi:isoleucyl-tRNA synthetase
MHDAVTVLCQLLAPILPHTADEAWSALHGGAPTSSVMATTHLDLGQAPRHGAWDAAFAVRERALKALESAKASGIENPLDAGVSVGRAIEADLPGALDALAAVHADLADLCGVSRVSLGGDGGVVVTDLRNEARCERSWRRDGTVRQRSDGGMLSDRDAAAVGVA